MKEISVGIIGFGTVGAGVAENLLKNRDVITSRTGLKINLKYIADLDITSDRGVAVPPGMLTSDSTKVIEECDIVVELIGGTTAARKLILQALNAGKSVVTANKALLALHGEELFAAAAKTGADICFEASVAGGIPIIKALREGFVSNRVKSIYGIMNGTCNYILTRMEREGVDFAPVLADAQKLGYAEAEPSLDIDGFDTAHKTAVLGALAYGKWFGMEPIYVEGIRNISLFDLRCADELGYRIKLLAIIKDIDGAVQLRVHPTMLPKSALLANISEVFNGVMVDGDTVGRTLFYGRGAGRSATASAVAADIVDAARNLAGNCRGRIAPFAAGELFSSITSMSEIESRYYLRIMVADQPGVIAAISRILGERNINISSLVQHESNAGNAGAVPLLVITGTAKEKLIQSAIAEIEKLPVTTEKVRLLRIEDI